MEGFLLHPALSTDRGRKRELNEDAIGYRYPSEPDLIRHYGALFIVADGVAGLAEGERASDFAVRQLVELYYQMPISTPQQQLVAAIEQVNSLTHTQVSGSATTIVAGVFYQDQLVVAYVGDSSAFWVDESGIQKLTNEHVTVVDAAHPTKTRLTRAIGHRPTVQVDSITIPVRSNGRLILVSDGITRYLTSSRLYQMTAVQSPQEAAVGVIGAANQAGGADNSSVVVVQVGQPFQTIPELHHHLGALPSPYVEAQAILGPPPSVPPKESTGVFAALNTSTKANDGSVVTSQVATSPTVMGRVGSGHQAPQESGYRVQSVATPPPNPSNSVASRFFVGFGVLAVVTLIILAVIMFIQTSEDTSESVPPSPTVTATVSATLTETPLPTQTLTLTPSPLPQPTDTAPPPSATPPDTIIDDGDQVRFEGSTLTYRSVTEGATSAFAIVPAQIYVVKALFSDPEGKVWYYLHDSVNDQDGWISQEELPTYEIVP